MSYAGKPYAGHDPASEVRDRLRQIAGGYSDTLRPDVRHRIVTRSVASLAQTVAGHTAPIWALIPKIAAAAAVAVILILPAFKPFRMQGAGPADTKTPIRDFQVTAQNGEVVLTWEDGDQPRRVVKATSREALAHLAEIPGEMVQGKRWVDTRPDEAQLVYYFVE